MSLQRSLQKGRPVAEAVHGTGLPQVGQGTVGMDSMAVRCAITVSRDAPEAQQQLSRKLTS